MPGLRAETQVPDGVGEMGDLGDVAPGEGDCIGSNKQRCPLLGEHTVSRAGFSAGLGPRPDTPRGGPDEAQGKQCVTEASVAAEDTAV